MDQKKSITRKQAPQRSFKSQQEIIHDLYKLTDGQCKKNIAWQENMKQFVDVTHNHFFHTVDANGRPQNTSSHTAGHFHVLEVIESAKDGSPAVYKCSTALKYVYKRMPDGQYQKTVAPYEGTDTHTHDLEYLHSEKFKPRKLHAEAMKVIRAEEQKTASVDGIVG